MSETPFARQEGVSYHPNVAAILRNGQGEILICERVDTPGAWQFPQGGIDPGETAEQALRRELVEEISVSEGYEIVERKSGYRYVYGSGFSKKGFQGKEQDYFLLQTTHDPLGIHLETEHPEFRRHQWIRPEDFQLSWLPLMKREVYRAVFADFFGVRLKL